MGLTQPEWFSKWKNVYESDWWWSGMNARNATMTATPTRCHQALMFESSLTRLTPKVLSSPWDSRMTANRMKVRTGVTAQPQARLAKAVQVSAAPKSIAAGTATSPRKLNHPTYQAQTALFLRASRPAQKYRPPAVGYTEQISPIASATHRTKTPTSGQPSEIAIGPPELMARPKLVMQPASTEMIENETAKFENPLIPRCSSCL